MLRSLCRRNMLCRRADHDAELDFIIELIRDLGLDDAIERPGDRGGMLVEPELLLRLGDAKFGTLFDMLAIVHPDREIFPGSVNRRKKPRRSEWNRRHGRSAEQMSELQTLTRIT